MSEQLKTRTITFTPKVQWNPEVPRTYTIAITPPTNLHTNAFFVKVSKRTKFGTDSFAHTEHVITEEATKKRANQLWQSLNDGTWHL